MTIALSPSRTFILTHWHREALIRRAIQGMPFEVCGFIMRDGRIKEIRNVSTNPTSEFQMDIGQLQRINPKDIVAIWHSHPSGKLTPSPTDQQHMPDLAAAYGDWAYLIVTKDDVAQYNTETDWSKFV
jgi:proteasome lid subunit RPN8/RPN11